MDRIEASTVVYVPPAEVYEFLLDFPGYASYSGYLETVEQHGTGDPGTEYGLTFAWWKVSYTARSKVIEVDPPNRIDWELVKDLNAAGYWSIEPADEDAVAANGGAEPDGPATRVSLVVEFDPASATPDVLDLPALVSLEWVVEKARPLVTDEAERVVERIVADLEGEHREVTLDVETGTDESSDADGEAGTTGER